MKVLSQFSSGWSIYWATTYTIDPALFEEFLLRRLGEPPLNACILADFGRLAEAWEENARKATPTVRRANRDYLVRGVRRRRAFHPKTQLLANTRRGVLLVGSGNLTLPGLEEGNEVISRFDSENEDDLQAIRAWRDWMQDLVQELGDPQVDRYWLDLLHTATWLTGPAAPSAFVSNRSRPIFQELVERIADDPVDELHVMAPFYDRTLVAIEALLHTLHPKAVHVYLARRTSVEGVRLGELLAGQPRVELHGFDPDLYVHAKLVGVVQGNRGTLLSGSANLSSAALLHRDSEDRGNVEVGTIVRTSAETLRSAFVPHGEMKLVDRPLDSLEELQFASHDTPPTDGNSSLASVYVDAQGHLVASIEHDGSERALFVTDGKTVVRLEAGRSIDPFTFDSQTIFVWLTDESGQEIYSNRVPLDDPVRLQRQLGGSGVQRKRHPEELLARDLDTPIGKLLIELSENCIFDFDATPAATQMRELEEAGVLDEEFWERRAREELLLDPRQQRYRAFLRQDTAVLDPIIELLERMRDEAPSPLRIRLLRQGLQAGAEEGESGGDGKHGIDDPDATGRWSPEARLRVRLYNVLERWSRALGDPRLLWISGMAPTRNYIAILSALAECWQEGYLDDDVHQSRVVSLLGTLFGAYVQTKRQPGHVARLDPNDRAAAVEELQSTGAAGLAAALLYASLRAGARDLKSYLFDWQAFLQPGLNWGLFEPDSSSSKIVAALLEDSKPVGHQEIRARLQWAVDYIDDPRWCERTARELDFRRISLAEERDRPDLDITVKAEAELDFLADPRVVRLARLAMQYKRAQGAVIYMPQGRLAIRRGKQVFALIGGQDGLEYESDDPIDLSRMLELEHRGAGWEAVLHEYRHLAG